jgi:hypothetical protein
VPDPVFIPEIPIGLDGLRSAMLTKDRTDLWLYPAGLVFHGPLSYRCRYCLSVLTTGDPGCGTCGAPKERQRTPRSP